MRIGDGSQIQILRLGIITLYYLGQDKLNDWKCVFEKVKQKLTETRLVIWFDSIMQGVSVEIELAYLKEINKKKIELKNLGDFLLSEQKDTNLVV